MTLVHIVYMPTADKMGPDLTRMGKVEDHPDEVARMLLNDGSARLPTDDEVAEYESSQQVEAKADEALSDGGDLTRLKKAELLDLAGQRGVEADESMTKADIAAALEAHQAEQPDPVQPSKNVPGSDLSIGLPDGTGTPTDAGGASSTE